MYLMCQQDYEKIYARIARNAVLQAAGDFEASAYWLNRSFVGDTMKKSLENYLDAAHVDVSGFMLLKIDLPDTYEMAIVKTQVTRQEIITYNQTRIVNMTNQVTENIKAKGLADIQRINANASAMATKVLNKGAGQVAKQNIEYTTLALKQVQTDLGFSSPKVSLMDYYFYQRIAGLKSDTKNKLGLGVDMTVLDSALG